MKKRVVSLTIAIALTALIDGCAGVSTGTAVQTKPTKLQHVQQVLKAPKYLLDLKSSVVVSDSGKRILDEEGDIEGVYTFDNGQSFYLLKVVGKDIYKIKTFDKKVLKTFNANSVISFPNKNEIAFAVKLSGNTTDIYDNVYLFDGEKFQLVNKNIDLRYAYTTGIYTLRTVYDRSSYYFIKYQELTNVITGKTIYNKSIPTKYKAKRKPIIIGARGDKVYYTYAVSGGMYYTFFIEAYDIKTKQNYVLVAGRTEPEIQILRAGNKAVLKVFNPQRYIDLDTLTEVKGISGNFEPATSKVSIMELRDNLVNLSHSQSVRPLF
jgi:hypothetical protein